MDRIRGFEKISENQFNKDFAEIIELYHDDDENPIIYSEIKLPQRATAKSAGYDVYSPTYFRLLPNEEIKLPTGIKAYMQDDEVLKAYPRSGLGFKYYLRFANTIPVIDADYINSDNEGHIWIKLRNEGTKIMRIDKGEAICQVIFEKYLLADGDNYTGKERNGGFGSTSKK
jgi:dUTP pyrophosphatase